MGLCFASAVHRYKKPVRSKITGKKTVRSSVPVPSSTTQQYYVSVFVVS